MKVPRVSMANWQSVNSEYTNQSLGNKDCYMCVTIAYAENCLYSYASENVRDSLDCYNIYQSELLYEAMHCTKCGNSAFLYDCADVTDSFFLKNCRGCTSCFGSYGLRNKSYYWKNEQLNKDEYEKRFSEFTFSCESIRKERESLLRLAYQYPHKYFLGQNIVNSVGDNIQDTKNSYAVFRSWEGENLRYCQDVDHSKDSIDCTEIWGELGYELEGVEAKSCIAVTKCVALFDSYYSELCSNSHDLFGCMGLKKAEYCIFNKRYSKEEYHKTIEKVIAHMKKSEEWGEFFPAVLSLFAYNETVAQDYFPLTEGEAVKKGMRWHQRKDRNYNITLQIKDIPKTIGEVNDSIVSQAIKCISQESEEGKQMYVDCTTAFRITPAELELYRKIKIPIPQKCPSCRRQDRMMLRNPRKLWKRACQCVGLNSENGIYQNTAKHFHGSSHCPNEFETSYAPERPEIVYCEACYQSEVV